jgi:hypothetical protein
LSSINGNVLWEKEAEVEKRHSAWEKHKFSSGLR